jgi:hypothetical protein
MANAPLAGQVNRSCKFDLGVALSEKFSRSAKLVSYQEGQISKEAPGENRENGKWLLSAIVIFQSIRSCCIREYADLGYGRSRELVMNAPPSKIDEHPQVPGRLPNDSVSVLRSKATEFLCRREMMRCASSRHRWSFQPKSGLRPDADHARIAAATTASVAVVPSASPFSKSPSVRAIAFVTCAKQMTDRCVAFANA